MTRLLPRAALALGIALAFTGCGGSQSPASGPSDAEGSSATKVTIGGNDALTWGKGTYGVVLAHGAAFDAASWKPQATAIAAQGMRVIAVEDISPEAIRDAVKQLKGQGVEDVALVGGSAGADSILDLASQEPDLPDQLILLSANGTVTGLGAEPKLFIASKEEPLADVSTRMAESSEGEDNQAMILPGSAHAQNIFATDQAAPVLDAILERLKRFGTD